MKTVRIAVLITLVFCAPVLGQFPSIGESGAGEPDSTAINFDDASFVAWATNVVSYTPGSEVASQFTHTENALGIADYSTLTLGRGGQVTLEFSGAIINGPGFDFAVFENAFLQSSLSTNIGFFEVAYVEVSVDGVNFFRFPSRHFTTGPVSPFSFQNTITYFNLAGKYHVDINAGINYGTPFDLDFLTFFYPSLDVNNIRYVRIVDVAGDGNALDFAGLPIYDPYPSVGSAGFDIDAIGVINFISELPSENVPVPAYAQLLLAMLLVALFRLCRKQQCINN